MGTSLTAVSLQDRPDLAPAHDAVGGAVWPEFMLHDPVAESNWDAILAAFPHLQVALVEGEQIAAVINAVAYRYEGALSDLPDRGVDWGVEKSVADHQAGVVPNTLMGLQVVVAASHRGQGLARVATQEMIALAQRQGMEQVLLPVRPNCKAGFPLIPMKDYLTWRTKDGRAFDPWMRVHEGLGGQVLGICPQSMIIPGTVTEWQDWTGQVFPGTGQYTVPGALCPVEIDIAADQGVYTEPNVWVLHKP